MTERIAAPPGIDDRLLTLREAAELLHMKPRTVRRYVRGGELVPETLIWSWRGE